MQRTLGILKFMAAMYKTKIVISAWETTIITNTGWTSKVIFCTEKVTKYYYHKQIKVDETGGI